MTIYISGAMKADPDYRNKFARAQAFLEERFVRSKIINPVEIADMIARQRFDESKPPIESPSFFLLHDLRKLYTCSHIIRIADGMPSDGADIELAFAKYAGITRLPDLEVV